MRCPYCKSTDDRVIDSREAEDGAAVRRRRECGACGRRYTTFERVDNAGLQVVKRSGGRMPYDRAKVIAASNSGKMDRYTAGGLLAPLDWSRQHVAPTPTDRAAHGNRPDCFALVQVQKDRTFKVVGGTGDKPWICFPGENSNWAEPTPTNFK